MQARTLSGRSWLAVVALAATLALLAGLLVAGARPSDPGSSGTGTTLGAGTVKPKPPPR